MAKKVRITWIKSGIGCSKRQKDTLRALGLRRLGQIVEHEANDAVMGMVSKVGHLVEVEELEE